MQLQFFSNFFILRIAVCIQGIVAEHQLAVSNEWQAGLALAGGLAYGAIFGWIGGYEPEMFIPRFLRRN